MLQKRLLSLALGLLLIPTGMALAAETIPQPIPKLTLEVCLKSGFDYSQDIQTAAKNIAVAQENLKQAKAALGPTVGYSVNRVEADSSSYNSGTISLDLPVFNHNKLINNLRVAELQLESTREDERQTKLELTYNIKYAFYDLWLKEQKLVVAQASYENLGQHYQTIKKYCEVGKKAGYELLEAEVAWKEQKAEVTSARSNVAIAKLTLATLIGINRDRDFQIDYDLSVQQVPEQFTLELKTLLPQAEKQRPDLRQAAQNIEIAKLNIAIAKANNNPLLSLSGSQNDLNNELQFTLGVSGTLYDNKATASKVKAAEETAEIARINGVKTWDTMRKSVQKVYQAIQVDLEKVLAYKANIDLSKEDLRLTEIRYSAGMSAIMDVRDRQLALDKARNNYYEAVASYVTDLAQLDLELGNST
jgi:outer membrane protein